MLSAPHRFRNRQRFKRALALPRVAGNSCFSLCGVLKCGVLKSQGSAKPAVENDWPIQKAVVDTPTQWAVVISKKVCRKAVDRNKLRRRLQALLRQHISSAQQPDPQQQPWQHYSGLVLIARPPAAQATFDQLSQQLTHLLGRMTVPAAP